MISAFLEILRLDDENIRALPIDYFSFFFLFPASMLLQYVKILKWPHLIKQNQYAFVLSKHLAWLIVWGNIILVNPLKNGKSQACNRGTQYFEKLLGIWNEKCIKWFCIVGLCCGQKLFWLRIVGCLSRCSSTGSGPACPEALQSQENDQ